MDEFTQEPANLTHQTEYFPKSISHVHFGRSPKKMFVKWEALSKKTWKVIGLSSTVKADQSDSVLPAEPVRNRSRLPAGVALWGAAMCRSV